MRGFDTLMKHIRETGETDKSIFDRWDGDEIRTVALLQIAEQLTKLTDIARDIAYKSGYGKVGRK